MSKTIVMDILVIYCCITNYPETLEFNNNTITTTKYLLSHIVSEGQNWGVA